jgi:hypothetical protein
MTELTAEELEQDHILSLELMNLKHAGKLDGFTPKPEQEASYARIQARRTKRPPFATPNL